METTLPETPEKDLEKPKDPADGKVTSVASVAEENKDTSKENKPMDEPEPKKIEVPEEIDINEFQQRSLNDLHAIAQELDLRVAGVRSKHQLIFEILQFYGKHGTKMVATGYLDCGNDNSAGFFALAGIQLSSECRRCIGSSKLAQRAQIETWPGNYLSCQVD